MALIFDEEIKKQPGVAASVKQFEGLGIDIVAADTIGELAAKIGVPATALEKTIADFNAAVKDGKAPDAQPAKTAFAYKVEKPKFYAFYPLSPGITLTFGGIRINEKAQAQEADGKVIPGLYSCGGMRRRSLLRGLYRRRLTGQLSRHGTHCGTAGGCGQRPGKEGKS